MKSESGMWDDRFIDNMYWFGLFVGVVTRGSVRRYHLMSSRVIFGMAHASLLSDFCQSILPIDCCKFSCLDYLGLSPFVTFFVGVGASVFDVIPFPLQIKGIQQNIPTRTVSNIGSQTAFLLPLCPGIICYACFSSFRTLIILAGD